MTKELCGGDPCQRALDADASQAERWKAVISGLDEIKAVPQLPESAPSSHNDPETIELGHKLDKTAGDTYAWTLFKFMTNACVACPGQQTGCRLKHWAGGGEEIDQG